MREDASRLLEPTTGRLLVRVQSGEHGHAGQRLRGKVRGVSVGNPDRIWGPRECRTGGAPEQASAAVRVISCRWSARSARSPVAA